MRATPVRLFWLCSQGKTRFACYFTDHTQPSRLRICETVQVVVTAAGQSSAVGAVNTTTSTAANVFAYAVPMLTSLRVPEQPLTSGGTPLTLLGTNFPTAASGWPVAVMVGPSPCVVDDSSRVDTTTVVCVTPPGAGLVSVTLYTPLQVKVGGVV